MPLADLHGLLLRVERQHGEHGPEDLLLHDAHAGLRAREERRLEEEAVLGAGGLRPRTTTDQLGALRDARFDVADDPLELRLGHEWSHVGVVHATTQPRARHDPADAVGHLGGQAPRHEDARPCAARLAGVVGDTARG